MIRKRHQRRIGELEAELTKALERIAQLEAEKSQLEHVAYKDPLTAVNNRRGFADRLQVIKQLIKSQPRKFRYQKPYFIMVDIDYFKKINDTHGHPAGDMVLQQFAKLLLASLRDYDIVGRFGGEEFVMALVDISPHEVIRKAKQLAAKIRSHRFRLPSGKTINISASFGLATSQVTADKALYQAKQTGRDKVMSAK
ncbi:GGDEF domain-containing protein [Candidatus Microgenomates bacterium]|nr:GGDEF domain-containing protein [Candidatus Microgenomates bacterium]